MAFVWRPKQEARLVCLQELNLSPYFAVDPDAGDRPASRAEDIPTGPTTAFAVRLAAETGPHVHASLDERVGSEVSVSTPRSAYRRPARL